VRKNQLEGDNTNRTFAIQRFSQITRCERPVAFKVHSRLGPQVLARQRNELSSLMHFLLKRREKFANVLGRELVRELKSRKLRTILKIKNKKSSS
jgi:hypothetical protein